MTSPFTVNAFWLGHLAAMRDRYDISVVVNDTDTQLNDVAIKATEGIRFVPLRIARQIAPVGDLKALRSLRRWCAEADLSAIVTITPKAGLLGMLSGRLSGVPVRMHWFTGQVWATRSGAMRQLLKTTDRVMARAATDLLADSVSQADFLAEQGIAPRSRISVLGSGSVSGVDCQRFKPDRNTRTAVRAELGIADDDMVVLFVGRLNHEKGIPELLEAHARLYASDSSIKLLLVGPDEVGCVGSVLPPGVFRVGYTMRVERYCQAADIFCLPSHREGFPTVILEAAACGLPSVAARVYGITDAVRDGVTGLLHTPRSVTDLAARIEQLARAPVQRQHMGVAGREWVLEHFTAERMTRLFIAHLDQLILSSYTKKNRAHVPAP
jgi:glycosyltransferase involved in cell wall biosynthesis